MAIVEERCSVDGGLLQIEVVDTFVHKSCPVCGVTEKEEIGHERHEDVPDPGAIVDQDAVQRAREEAVLRRQARDEAAAERREARLNGQDSAQMPVAAREPRAAHAATASADPSTWMTLAEQRLTELCEQLQGVGSTAREAMQIHTALIACGKELPPLPATVFDIARLAEEQEALAPPKHLRTGRRKTA